MLTKAKTFVKDHRYEIAFGVAASGIIALVIKYPDAIQFEDAANKVIVEVHHYNH